MKTKAIIAAIAIVFALLAVAGAASDRCVVMKAEENTLILKCKKDTAHFKPGTEIKIKTSRKAALEGC